MDFFANQDRARAMSRRLVVLFALAVVLTFLALHSLTCVFCAMVRMNISGSDFVYQFVKSQRDPQVILADIAIVGAIVVGGSWFRLFQLRRQGVKGVVESLGGVAVMRGAKSTRERRLYNVVEEMAIAAGCPVPAVYILDSEHGINACAVGSSIDDAAICVTSGALDCLTRDELQGVIAHEFSHIVNSDMRLNMRLIGLLFGIELIAIIGLWCARLELADAREIMNDDSKKDRSILGQLVFALIAGIVFLIGSFGVFLGNIIRAAISRQREFLADASAVEFTRDPSGISGALKKIGGAKEGSAVNSTESAQMSHMFFGSVFSGGFFSKLYQTHPNLLTRIRALEPTFDGIFPENVSETQWEAESEDVPVSGFVGMKPQGERTASSSREKFLIPQKATQGPEEKSGVTKESSFVTSPSHLYGKWQSSQDNSASGIRVSPVLLERAPSEFDEILVDSQGAMKTVFATLLDSEPAVRNSQLGFVGEYGADFSAAVDELSKTVALSLPETTRLLVVRESTPLLKTLSLGDYQRFRKTLLDLCNADGRTSFFEYTVVLTTIRSLDVFFGIASPPKVRYTSLKALRNSLLVVLETLAREGAVRTDDVKSAFETATHVVGFDDAQLTDSRGHTLKSFTESLNELSCAAPAVKKIILQACWSCILYDNYVTPRESAILSAISAALGVPAPVWRKWS